MPIKKLPKGEYVIYCDGSSLGNGKPGARGGWGFVILDAKEKHVLLENSGGKRETTNNQMEMTAAIEAIEHVEKGSYLTVITDSNYVVKGATEWIHGWIRRGWRTAGGDDVKNEGLWHHFIEACEGKRFVWKWVKGHAGNKYNERCDVLATSAAGRL